jgi:prepilin-type N-terminal cleavage/methylation domain-containing protein
MMQRNRQIFTICKNNSGFSFIELMAVMAILGILANIAITSFIATRTKVLDAAAFAETQSLGKAVLNSFLDGIDVNLAHNEGGGREIGTMDTSGNGRVPIFTFSSGMQAQIVGNSNSGGPGSGICQATVWHQNGTKSYWLFIDEAQEITSFPTS